MTQRWRSTLISIGLLVAGMAQAAFGFIMAENLDELAALSPVDNLTAFAGLGLAMTGVLTAWLSRRPGEALQRDKQGQGPRL